MLSWVGSSSLYKQAQVYYQLSLKDSQRNQQCVLASNDQAPRTFERILWKLTIHEHFTLLFLRSYKPDFNVVPIKWSEWCNIEVLCNTSMWCTHARSDGKLDEMKQHAGYLVADMCIRQAGSLVQCPVIRLVRPVLPEMKRMSGSRDSPARKPGLESVNRLNV